MSLISDCLETDDARGLIRALDTLKGSYAVEKVLTVLLGKENKHTLQSALELLREGHGTGTIR